MACACAVDGQHKAPGPGAKSGLESIPSALQASPGRRGTFPLPKQGAASARRARALTSQMYSLYRLPALGVEESTASLLVWGEPQGPLGKPLMNEEMRGRQALESLLNLVRAICLGSD